MVNNALIYKVKPKFSYDTGISPLDLIKDPELIVNRLENTSILCLNCHSAFTFKLKEEYVTEKCNCGVRIFYPKGNETMYKTKFISREQYFKNKEIEREWGKERK